MPDSLLVIEMALFALIGIILASGLGYLRCKPAIWRAPPTNVLVLVAHPDDCVAMAGEYAIWAVTNGMKVDLVYFTSGATNPGSSRAMMREKEAVKAWMSIGVPEEHLHFLRNEMSPLNGPSRLGDCQLNEASAEIRKIVLSVVPGTAVFVPAAGEHHTDHRTVRQVGLKAIVDSGRQDLLVLEAPEYNPSLSLMRSPKKVAQYLLKSLPVLWRIGGDLRNSAFPGFIHGGPAFMICDDTINAKKREMLRCFASEDGEKLVWHFGFQNQFRPVVFPLSAGDDTFGPFYLRFGTRRLALSVAGLLLAFYLFVVGVFMALTTGAIALLQGDNVSALVTIGILVALLAVATIRSRKRVESAILYASGIVGIMNSLGSILY